MEKCEKSLLFSCEPANKLIPLYIIINQIIQKKPDGYQTFNCDPAGVSR